ncbi:lysophospholipid acyltransferase 2-like isoform X2 [Hyla sarda]|uniref:lysophospholipid acyltransferase 2-like isoform X2 n=1 Tax=Hyla sarda TaxID=327740 RepID=UPI0024C35589|nr:lysophospholipid acyltransferase 2-like isoform X2 [Hyla sarda]
MKEAGESDGAPLQLVRKLLRELPIEQRLFLTGQLAALILAFLFRYCLPPSHCGPKVRHGIASLLGICLSVYCFGWLTVFLVGEVVMCYLMLLMVSTRRIQIFANPLVDELDFTVALMTLTQKLSRFAFEYHDGTVRSEQSLTPTQRRLAIRSLPGILPYLSYNVGFLGLLAGPLCSFNDYQIFIHGEEKNRNPNVAVFKKLWLCCFLLTAHIMMSDQFSISNDPNTSVLYLFVELYLTAASRRPKYYFAWTLADAINNAAGFGYNGISDDGEERWDLLSNLNILKIETATSFKMYIDNWNIQTAVWLKEVCYDRSPFNPLLSTFLLSAAWHGVHPGYYFTFLTAAPITVVARRVRQTIRPWFQHSSRSRLSYSLITWLCTQIAMTYTVAPFILLGLGPSLQLYRSLGFCFHILPALLLLILPDKNRLETKGGSSKESACDRNYNHLKKEM